MFELFFSNKMNPDFKLLSHFAIYISIYALQLNKCNFEDGSQCIA